MRYHMMFNGRKLCSCECEVLPERDEYLAEHLVIVKVVKASGCSHRHVGGGTYSCPKSDLMPVA